MIHVAVCSSTPAMRAGLRALVSGDPDLVVTFTSASLDALPGGEDSPRVVVATADALDPPGETWPAVLLVTDEPAEIRRLAARGLPAWGVITPDAPAEALQAAVRALAEGLVVLSAELSQALLESPPAALEAVEEEGGRQDHLTAREGDVLSRLAQGLTNKQIALALKISEHTVKYHVSSIYSKLGVSNRTEAVRKGARRGLIPL